LCTVTEGTGNETETSWLGFVLRALKYRNYRLFFAGQIVSLVGNWMTSIATAWLVYRLTHSPTLLGVVGFAGQIPAFLLAPIAGVLVDRWDLRRCIVVTQTLAMIQSFALAYFTLRGTIDVPHLIVLAIMQGLINAFDIPARQSFVVQIVDRREDLSNAIALNSSIVNAARLLGPGAAGILIAAVGEATCFLLDGFSYIAVIIALLMMRLPRKERSVRTRNVITELREGVAAALGFTPIRAILLLLSLVSLAGLPYITLLPIFATDVLHRGPQALGLLSAGAGAGALVGAARCSAWAKSSPPPPRLASC
jgi:MFS family permease